METEIKLLLPPASRPRVEAHPLFAAAAPNVTQNVSTYFDTPDFALRQRASASGSDGSGKALSRP